MSWNYKFLSKFVFVLNNKQLEIFVNGFNQKYLLLVSITKCDYFILCGLCIQYYFPVRSYHITEKKNIS